MFQSKSLLYGKDVTRMKPIGELNIIKTYVDQCSHYRELIFHIVRAGSVENLSINVITWEKDLLRKFNNISGWNRFWTGWKKVCPMVCWKKMEFDLSEV